MKKEEIIFVNSVNAVILLIWQLKSISAACVCKNRAKFKNGTGYRPSVLLLEEMKLVISFGVELEAIRLITTSVSVCLSHWIFRLNPLFS